MSGFAGVTRHNVSDLIPAGTVDTNTGEIRQVSESRVNILKALLAASIDIGGYIQKDKKSAVGYTYASEAAIKEHVFPKLRNHGIVVTINESDYRVVEISTNKGKETISIKNVVFTFYHAETGEFVVCTGVGSGNGRDDKGNYAATTGAIKYVLTAMLGIATGDDPEADDGNGKADKPKPAQVTKKNDGPGPSTQVQYKKIVALFKELGDKVDLKQSGLPQWAFDITRTMKEKLSGATEIQAAEVISELESAIKRAK